MPLALEFYGANQGWSIESEIDTQVGELALSMYFSRSGTTKFFSIFIVVLMWLLSLSLLTLSITLWVRKRRVEPPTIVRALTVFPRGPQTYIYAHYRR